jgi:hypothetical protein
MLVEVAIVSLSNDLPVLGCPIHGSNIISCRPILNQAEARSLKMPTDNNKNINHVGSISQDGAYCHVTPCKLCVLLEPKVFVSIRNIRAFMFSFEESINRLNSFGSSCWPRVPMREPALLEYTKWFGVKKIMKILIEAFGTKV